MAAPSTEVNVSAFDVAFRTLAAFPIPEIPFLGIALVFRDENHDEASLVHFGLLVCDWWMRVEEEFSGPAPFISKQLRNERLSETWVNMWMSGPNCLSSSNTNTSHSKAHVDMCFIDSIELIYILFIGCTNANMKKWMRDAMSIWGGLAPVYIQGWNCA